MAKSENDPQDMIATRKTQDKAINGITPYFSTKASHKSATESRKIHSKRRKRREKVASQGALLVHRRDFIKAIYERYERGDSRSGR